MNTASVVEKTAPLDTRYLVETPEGIDLHAQLAGPIPRALAYLIDMAIRTAALALLAILLGLAGNAGWGIFMLLFFLLEWFYPVVFEVYRGGQTPGKKALAIMAVNDDLTPVNWSTSTVRNLLRAVDFFPLAYMGGLCAMVLSSRFQRMGDLAAGTLVIYKPAINPPLSLPNVRAEPTTMVLDVADQIAITSFTQRHQQLSLSRQQELAAILSPRLHCDDDQALTKLQSIGCWLLGNKS